MRVAVVNKKPAERFAVGFKYSAADLAADAVIQSVTAVISPVEVTGGLTIVGVPAKDDYTVSAMLAGGTDRHEYYVTFTVNTSAGQIFVDKVFVKVRA